MEHLGSAIEDDRARELYRQLIDSFESWPALRRDTRWREVVEDETTGFALFLACDSSALPTEAIGAFAEYCLDHGVFWVSTFGSDCGRVHDVFDEVDTERGIDGERGIEDRGVVMTTWHDDESLRDALGLFWHAFPDEPKSDGPARVVLIVERQEWLEVARLAAADDLAG